MKKTALFACLLFSYSISAAQSKWLIDKNHSRVGFSATHLMISEVEGNFRKYEASFISSKDDFSDAVFDLIVEAASVNTENEKRDNDLRSERFLDVVKYPQIAFKSKSITRIDNKKYKLSGDLTIHGVTKPVVLDLILTGTGKNMQSQKPLAAFKASTTINRKDFNVGTLPAAVVGEEVEIRAAGEFERQN